MDANAAAAGRPVAARKMTARSSGDAPRHAADRAGAAARPGARDISWVRALLPLAVPPGGHGTGGASPALPEKDGGLIPVSPCTCGRGRWDGAPPPAGRGHPGTLPGLGACGDFLEPDNDPCLDSASDSDEETDDGLAGHVFDPSATRRLPATPSDLGTQRPLDAPGRTWWSSFPPSAPARGLNIQDSLRPLSTPRDHRPSLPPPGTAGTDAPNLGRSDAFRFPSAGTTGLHQPQSLGLQDEGAAKQPRADADGADLEEGAETLVVGRRVTDSRDAEVHT